MTVFVAITPAIGLIQRYEGSGRKVKRTHTAGPLNRPSTFTAQFVEDFRVKPEADFAITKSGGTAA